MKYYYYLRKGYNRLLKLLKIILDLCLFIILIPVYAALALYLAIVGRNSKKQKTAIFCGLEHVIQKTITRGEYFKKQGFQILYLSFEKTHQSEIDTSNKEVIKIRRFLAIDVLCFITILIRRNPVYVELYYEGLGVYQLIYSILLRVNRTITISIHRGIAENYNKVDKTRNFLRFLSYKIANAVFYRDPKMFYYFKKMGINKSKLFYDYNRVKIYSEPNIHNKGKELLFLNGIQRFRRIDILIEAIPIVLGKIPDAHLTIVGCRNDREYKYVTGLVSRFKVASYVSIRYWTATPKVFYDKASVFILPADIVFCNFSLIESMERGVPPIVANVEDADKIVQHGKNGYLAEQTAEDIAKYIIHLLGDEASRKEMGKNARETVINNFNDKDRMAPILSLIMNKYPYLPL